MLPPYAAADQTAVLPPYAAAPRQPAPRPAPTAPAPTPAPRAPRDPWAESSAAASLPLEHDPHEVTVQMDAVMLGDTRLRPVKAGPGAAQDGSDGPVFVDESGRRSRTFRRLGIAIGLACAVYAVVIVATLLSGSSSAPWVPVPAQGGDDKPAGQVDPSTVPSVSATPTSPGSSEQAVTPSASPTATAGTRPGSTPGAHGSGTSLVRPSSAGARTPSGTSTSSAGASAGTGSKSPGTPSTPPGSGSSHPSTPSGGGSFPHPSADPAAGSDTVADGPVAPAPAQVTPTATDSSPENVL
ncbi:hypothetical protein C3489_24765 [Streptomyces sp. Ru71]|uniref:hypothetical protein n=1 Tax=Streptomyces sp. Ru71 TaxID=2080746 RepID=UPI000CDD4A38|nr:hypothetical protein [Streptomyces sp. Ru71]POX49410.1 hypothetical protein C3489_24765 [Streptomyces sp. Ru71]